MPHPFVDSVVLKLEAGHGGEGAVAFHRALYVPKGGPSGGHGGDGGSIFFEGDANLKTLIDLRYKPMIKGHDGTSGGNKNHAGKNGKDLIVRVPLGCRIFNLKTQTLLVNITKHKQKHLLASGGRGGRGNASFATPRNRAPRLFEGGERGQHLEICCELNILADVGLVGLPNAGKSTLLSVISNSKPKIGNYPFTTLKPSVGIVRLAEGESFVVADLPGIIEGAHLGKGLGNQFLQHTKRCHVIIHLVDIATYDADTTWNNYQIIEKELASYSPVLAQKTKIIVANKIDMPEAEVNFKTFLTHFNQSENVFAISAFQKKHLTKMLWHVNEVLKQEALKEHVMEDTTQKIKVYQYKPRPKVKFKINRINKNHWTVEGEAVLKIIDHYPLKTRENWLKVNAKLQNIGLFNALRARGIEIDDVVDIYSYKLIWK